VTSRRREGALAESDGSGLIERFRRGDGDALRSLLERHGAELSARIRRCLPRGLDRKVAVSDILQESVLLAHERREDLEDRGTDAFRNWMLGIVERKAMEAVRRHDRTAKRSARREVTRAERPETGAFAGRGPSPSEAAIGAELTELARVALSRLPPDHREVLRLSREEHLSLKEAAERMDRSHAATRQLYGRALCRFREVFESLKGGSDG
jgi:RNA polymerase sigma-70 factor (ECF subfamily)